MGMAFVCPRERPQCQRACNQVRRLSPQPPPVPPNPPALEMRPRLLPVFFGEGIEVNPEPAHEIR